MLSIKSFTFWQYLTGEYVPLWKFNKSQVLFAGNLKINPRDQYDLDEQRTLIINKVTNENQGIYSCFVSTKPPNEIDHYLYILCMLISLICIVLK